MSPDGGLGEEEEEEDEEDVEDANRLLTHLFELCMGGLRNDDEGRTSSMSSASNVLSGRKSMSKIDWEMEIGGRRKVEKWRKWRLWRKMEAERRRAK